ncbi:hypothetical protein M9458_048589, partial [Cirrhinus mrigala]
RSSAHCNMAEGELVEDLGLLEAEGLFDIDMYADLPPLLPPSSEPTKTAMPELGPERALLPELSHEEAHKCPLTHPLMPPPPLSPGNPSAHPQPSICAVGLQRVCHSPSALWLEDPVASPWRLAPSSPPSGVDHPASRHSTPPASPRPSGSVRLLHPLAPLRAPGSMPLRWSPPPSAPPQPPRSSMSPWLIGSLSPPWASPPL